MTPGEIGLGLALFGTITGGAGLKAGLWSAKRETVAKFIALEKKVERSVVQKDVCEATHSGLMALLDSQHKEIIARLDKMNGSGG